MIAELHVQGRCERLIDDSSAPVQIAGGVEMSSINADALFIEHDGIPDVERSGILEPESTEVKLTLANSMHQLDALNRDRGTREPFEAEHYVRSGLDVSMILLDQVLRGPDLRVLRQQAIGLHFTHGPVRGSVSIECDRLWRVALMFDGLAEKGFGRGYIALRTEHEVHYLAGPIPPR